MAGSAEKPKTRSLISPDIVVFLLLGVLGFGFSVIHFFEAFPAASMNISVSRGEAKKIAEKYAKLSGFDSYEINSSTYFSSDKDVATFLEYELGGAEANRLMSTTVPVWHWTIDLDKRHSFEGFEAEIGTDGSLHSFKRALGKDYFMGAVSDEQARNLAIQFIKSEMGAAVNDWKLITESQEVLKSRVDRAYTWEDERTDFKGGRLRIHVELAGDQVVQLAKYLHVPDAFEHKFATLRAQNHALSEIPWIVTSVGLFSMPFVFLWAWMRRQIRVRLAVIMGITATLLSLISELNDVATRVVVSTKSNFESYVGTGALHALGVSILIGIGFTIFFAAIEVLYRAAYPRHVAIEKIFDGSGLRSTSVFKGALLGLALLGVSTGYQVAFYIIGKHCGFWIPLDVNERSVLSSFCPAWDAVWVGLHASAMEELGFRVFLLVVLQKLTRSFWIANILQATIWGFAHCNYAVEPPYARGVELSLAGLVAGCILRRYGLLPLVISHYAFDAYVSVMPLLCSHNLLDKLAGAATLLPAVALPVVSFVLIKMHGAIKESEIDNASITIPRVDPGKADVIAQPLPSYKPLQSESLKYLSWCLVLSVMTLFVPLNNIGKDPMFTVNRNQAIALARDYFKKDRIDVKDKQAVAWVAEDEYSTQMQYVFEQSGYRKTKALERYVEPRVCWTVYFFKAGDPETYKLKVSPAGVPLTSLITLTDTTSGAKLTPAEAQKLAEDYFKQTAVGQSGQLKMTNVTRKERPARTDYSFEAEMPGLRVKDAPFKLEVDVIGDHLTNFDLNWVVPDKWKFDWEPDDRATKMVDIGRILITAIALLNIGYWLLQLVRRNSPNWRLIALMVSVATGLQVLRSINYEAVNAFVGYRPSDPVNTLVVKLLMDAVIHAAMTAFGMAVMITIVAASYYDFLPQEPLQTLLKRVGPQLRNSSAWFDALLSGLTAAAFIGCAFHVSEFLLKRFSPLVPLTSVSDIGGFEQFSPVFAVLRSSLMMGLMAPLVVAVIAKWVKEYECPPGQLAVISLICVGLCYGKDKDPATFGIHVGCMMLVLFASYVFTLKIGRYNVGAYFFAGLFFELGRGLQRLMSHDLIIHPLDVAVVWCVIAVPILVILYVPLRKMFMQKRSRLQAVPAKSVDEFPDTRSE